MYRAEFKLKKWVLAVAVLTVLGALLRMSPFNRTVLAAASAPSAPSAPSFIAFETGQVRPLAMSPDRTKLFAVNTPDGTLEIFRITPRGLALQARVSVGMEPVAVAARNDNEVWVVNHLSDSVSIVHVSETPHVTHTLLVGDEPRDIVFAGSPARAFITTAHRGQQRTHPSIANVPGAGDPQLTTPSVPRADVWVFDPAQLGNTVGGTPLKIMSFFTDTPRALAVTPDGNTVYVAGFRTGNQTTTIVADLVCPGFQTDQPCQQPDGSFSPGGQLGPPTNFEFNPAPHVSLIVKFNNVSGHWEDELHRNWDNDVKFTLPDLDVFAINTNTLKQQAAFAHVGTTLFNMIVNPVNRKLYVSNSDAINNVRFEGPGRFGGHTVQGHLAEMRITVIDGSKVTPIHLNKHIDYSKLANSPGFDPTTKNHSLSTPLGMEMTRDGKTLFVAAFGSSKIGVFDTVALEKNTFNPSVDSANYIPVSGGGPSGLVLDEARGLLYVMTRFDNSIKVIELSSKKEIAAAVLPNPEPLSVIQGRRLLYDGNRSANGEAACASCHIFGDNDDLAWDLGNPDAVVKTDPIPQPLNLGTNQDFHPMKGPQLTQTLRGLRNSGAMHWRGDRSNGFFGIDPFDTNLSFNNFIVAFQDLLGAESLPSPEEMQQFTDFQLQVLPPPNPVRSVDNSLTASQQIGHDFFFGGKADTFVPVPASCGDCHELNRATGQFGTVRDAIFMAQVDQSFKVPQLRTAYTKIGMFGLPKVAFLGGDNEPMGDQIRGFGYTNDGSFDTIFRFVTASVFKFPNDDTRRDVEQYLFAFDSDLAPIVGQQVTLRRDNAGVARERIKLFEQRAGAPFTSKELGGAVTECDLVAKVALEDGVKGFLFNPASGRFISRDGVSISDDELRDLAAVPRHEVTFTCVPPGSGSRIAFNQEH